MEQTMSELPVAAAVAAAVGVEPGYPHISSEDMTTSVSRYLL